MGISPPNDNSALFSHLIRELDPPAPQNYQGSLRVQLFMLVTVITVFQTKGRGRGGVLVFVEKSRRLAPRVGFKSCPKVGNYKIEEGGGLLKPIPINL